MDWDALDTIKDADLLRIEKGGTFLPVIRTVFGSTNPFLVLIETVLGSDDHGSTGFVLISDGIARNILSIIS